MKKIHFLPFLLILGSTAPTLAVSQQYAPQKPFSLQLSVFAGVNPTLTINGQANAALGVRAGLLHETGLYVGGVWSIHPFVIHNWATDEPMGAAPKVICGELGWEFQLTPTTFLRPYLSLGRSGIDKSYQGYGGVTLLPAAETTGWGLGVIYSVQLSRDVLVGIEARGVWLAGLHITGNISYRLF
jgi:hypothetical protein